LSACAASTIQYREGSQAANKGIASLEDIKLNGLRFATLIRGENLDNPILMYIHGMGTPSMCFAFDEYQNDSVKEKTFTIVHYDQRGFGKTYRHGHHGKKYLTVNQYVSDAEQMVQYLLNRFNKQKIYLLGESFGSVVGAELVAKHPEWFYAYIAVPQVGSVKQYLNEAYNFATNHAVADSNFDAIKELSKFGTPASELSKAHLNKSIGYTGKWMDYYNYSRYGGEDMTGYFFRCLWNAPEYSLFDFTNTMKGFYKIIPTLNKDLINFDLNAAVPRMNAPVYVIIGAYDIMYNTSKQYFDALNAQHKYWLPIDSAGHMVRGEQYTKFDSLLYNKILPETYQIK
jgi:pimeloyl-ACP methyl ester carboxylesterase